MGVCARDSEQEVVFSGFGGGLQLHRSQEIETEGRLKTERLHQQRDPVVKNRLKVLER